MSEFNNAQAMVKICECADCTEAPAWWKELKQFVSRVHGVFYDITVWGVLMMAALGQHWLVMFSWHAGGLKVKYEIHSELADIQGTQPIQKL